MKAAKVGAAVSTAVASWQHLQQGGSGSQIPLPLRRGLANKGGSESEPLDADSCKDMSRKSNGEKISVKTSILGSSSFCCTSGQKEDYLPEPVKPQPNKKKPSKPLKKKDAECHEFEPSTPILPRKQFVIPRGRSAKADTETDEGDKASRDKRSTTDVPVNRPRALLPPSIRSPRMSAKVPDRKKIPPDPSGTAEKMHQGLDTRSHTETELNGRPKHTETTRKLGKDFIKGNANSLVSPKSESKSVDVKLDNRDVSIGNTTTATIQEAANICKDIGVLMSVNQLSDGVMAKGYDTEDFDCPCCNSGLGMDDTEVEYDPKVADSTVCINELVEEVQKKRVINAEFAEDSETANDDAILKIKTLKAELEQERQNLKDKEKQIEELQNELKMMQQLKDELAKEKALRQDAEMKLLKVLESGAILKSSTKTETPTIGSEQRMTDLQALEDDSSPILPGYESRIRRYQMYISKLEKDNAMLVGELKKLKDLSPCSQNERGMVLLDKLSQLEKDNQQQQLEYESCLDEVANKLVHTLLIQKRLEEECRVLQLRVEQLEVEKSEILKSVESAKTDQISVSGNSAVLKEYVESVLQPSLEESHKRLQVTEMPEPSCIELPTTSTPQKCQIPTSAEHKMSSSDSNVHTNDKHPSASKIPAFNNIPKPSPTRKRTKNDIPNNVTQEKLKSTRILNREPARSESSEDNEPRKGTKIASPSRASSSTCDPSRTVESSTTAKSKLLLPTEKFTGVKRKRSNKSTSHTSDKSSKDSKWRLSSKSQHIRWDNKIESPKALLETGCRNYSTFSKATTVLPPEIIPNIDSPPRVPAIWSFNCTIDNDSSQGAISEALQSAKLKLKSSRESSSFHDNIDEELKECDEKLGSPLRESESSISADGMNKTRDEGYSTMSSDQQQDSAADTTVSEQEEPSATFIVPEIGSRFISDDSVTECLDGSMTSSSDSGFGPLQQIALRDQMGLDKENKLVMTPTKKDTDSENFIITSIASYVQDPYQPPTILPEPSRSERTLSIQQCNLSSTPTYNAHSCFTYHPDNSSTKHYNTIFFGGTDDAYDVQSRPCDTNLSLETFINDRSHNVPISITKPNVPPFLDQISPHPYKNSTTPPHSLTESVCSMIQCALDKELKEDRVETAEKATLTEPEEHLWREKALAHFIDESIWSLYSSESETHVKILSSEHSKESSPFDHLETIFTCPQSHISVQHPAVISKNTSMDNTIQINDACAQSSPPEMSSSCVFLSTPLSDLSEDEECHRQCDVFNVQNFFRSRSNSRVLERTSSDSVLYLKDAVHELEDAMKPGLKTTRNLTSKHIPLVIHFSMSDVRSLGSSPLITKDPLSPEILLNLEKTMLQNNFNWPLSMSPSRSSSMCSLSLNSCHVVSDGTDDVDVICQPSRKGSQDPDLSSASDAENQNLEHKDFVEQWIHKEITQKNELKYRHANEIQAVKRKPANWIKSRNAKFLRSPTKCASITKGKFNDIAKTLPIEICSAFADDNVSTSSTSSLVYPIIFTCENIENHIESNVNLNEIEVDLKLLDNEVKEFNGDFYRLCDLGSSQSLEPPQPVVTKIVDDRNVSADTNGKQLNSSSKIFGQSSISEANNVDPEKDKIEHMNFNLNEIKSVSSHIENVINELNGDDFNDVNISRDIDSSNLSFVKTDKHLESSRPYSYVDRNIDIPRAKPQSRSMNYSKPTGLVKPIRPVTLAFVDVPEPLKKFERGYKKSPRKSYDFLTESRLKNSITNVPHTVVCHAVRDRIPSMDLNTSPKQCNNRPMSLKQRKASREWRHTVLSTGKSVDDNCSYDKPNICLPHHQRRESGSFQSYRDQKKSWLKSNRHSDTYNGSNKMEKSTVNNASLQSFIGRNGLDVAELSSPEPKTDDVHNIKDRPHWRKDRSSSILLHKSKEGSGTAWVHLQANPKLSDPKERASLLDSLTVTVSSSESSSDENDDYSPLAIHSNNSNLQRICRDKRQKIKASRGDGILVRPRYRSTVINRNSLYYRFGEQEEEAMACFDFLEEIPTSASEPGSLETFNRRLSPPNELTTTKDRSRHPSGKERVNLLSPCASDSNSSRSRTSSFSSKLKVPLLWNKPLSHNMSSSTLNSQDCEILDHISLSDSCAESYSSSTPDSFEETS